MHPHKVNRATLKNLTDLPNVGKAMADDLRVLGYHFPQEITGACPFAMYQRLCVTSNIRHDPCVIDVFMSITEFLSGSDPQPWWEFSKIRKVRIQNMAITSTHSI